MPTFSVLVLECRRVELRKHMSHGAKNKTPASRGLIGQTTITTAKRAYKSTSLQIIEPTIAQKLNHHNQPLIFPLFFHFCAFSFTVRLTPTSSAIAYLYVLSNGSEYEAA